MTKSKLYQKFLKVQQDLKPLSKSGNNSFHKYSYTTATDALEPVKEACNAQGLIIYADVVESTAEPGKAWVKVSLTVADIESGETISISAPGYAEDFSWKNNQPTGDKAVFKAITGATKYAIRSLFCIPSQDDPEASGKGQFPKLVDLAPKPGAITRSQKQQLIAIAYEQGGYTKEGAKRLLAQYGYNSSSEVKTADYERICTQAGDRELAQALNQPPQTVSSQ